MCVSVIQKSKTTFPFISHLREWEKWCLILNPIVYVLSQCLFIYVNLFRHSAVLTLRLSQLKMSQAICVSQNQIIIPQKRAITIRILGSGLWGLSCKSNLGGLICWIALFPILGLSPKCFSWRFDKWALLLALINSRDWIQTLFCSSWSPGGLKAHRWMLVICLLLVIFACS